jgi:hypothetical protein
LQSSSDSAQQKDAQFQKHLPLLFMHASRITDSHKEAYKSSSVSKYPAKLVDSMRLLLATKFG